jgi:hypothetical protein
MHFVNPSPSVWLIDLDLVVCLRTLCNCNFLAENHWWVNIESFDLFDNNCWFHE